MATYWVILIILAATILLLWLVFGINWRSKRNYYNSHHRMRERLQAEYDEQLMHLLYSGDDIEKVDEYYRPLCRIMTGDGRPNVTTSDEVEVITSGARKYELIMRDIAEAKESVHLEYFHFGIDKGSREVRSLLMQKAREGVKVRFINENITNFPIPRIYYNRMRKAGVDVRHFTNNRFSIIRFLLTLSYRDHRKIMVIDGRIAYTGGMNINDHYFKQWKDTHLRLTGKSVAHLQFTFLETWIRIGGRLPEPLRAYMPVLDEHNNLPEGSLLTQITPDDPTSPEAVLQTAYEWILNHAQRYVWLQSPYLAPPDSLVEAVRNAVKRGVDVRIMVPEHCDTVLMKPINRSFYNDFIQTGAQLYLRSGEFNHSKTIVTDNYLSMVGTTNLDNRSFGIDYEIDTFFYNKQMALQCKATFESELPNCRLLTKQELDKQSWIDKKFCNIMRVLAPIV